MFLAGVNLIIVARDFKGGGLFFSMVKVQLNLQEKEKWRGELNLGDNDQLLVGRIRKPKRKETNGNN